MADPFPLPPLPARAERAPPPGRQPRPLSQLQGRNAGAVGVGAGPAGARRRAARAAAPPSPSRRGSASPCRRRQPRPRPTVTSVAVPALPSAAAAVHRSRRRPRRCFIAGRLLQRGRRRRVCLLLAAGRWRTSPATARPATQAPRRNRCRGEHPRRPTRRPSEDCSPPWPPAKKNGSTTGRFPTLPEDPDQPPMGPAPGIDLPEFRPRPPWPTCRRCPPPAAWPNSSGDELLAEEQPAQTAGSRLRNRPGTLAHAFRAWSGSTSSSRKRDWPTSANPTSAPAPLYDVYPGVNGLSMRHGREAQLDPRRAATLDALSRKLRVYVAHFAPVSRRQGSGAPPGFAPVMYAEMRGRKPEWLRPEAIPC